MTHDQLAQGLLQAVRDRDFAATIDPENGDRPLTHFPSIDLAVVAFPRDRAPVWANVLFSRDHPRGFVAELGADGGPPNNVHFVCDERDARLDSFLWKPGAVWSQMHWRTLQGRGPHRFVAPYPASLLKMMVAVGVAMAVDRGLTPWPEADMAAMITVSDNDATDRLVALLHRLKMIEPLQQQLRDWGLATLRLEGTTAAGGWRNADGAGVGRIHMTAWDSVRLMWLLDAEAPAPPWLPAKATMLAAASRARLRRWMDAQQLDEILSSRSLAQVPGWVPGIPAQLRYAHKTGTTDSYASDAGIVRGRGPETRHYIVAVLTTLGRRYAPHPACATTWRLPALGAAIDALLAPSLEAPAR